jgi:hypothetical protein
MEIRIITLLLIVIAIIAVIVLIFYFDVFGWFKVVKVGRPEYCDSNGCVPKDVFRKLPEYPEDFEKVKTQALNLESVNKTYPDEYYYKQPEFYGSSFFEHGLYLYTQLSKPKNFSYMNVMGYGNYPSDVQLIVKEGEYELTDYLRAGWGVVKYQGLSLETVYPENEEITRKCFNVTLIPSTFLLGRTYLSFDPDWVKRVKIKIKVDKSCPSGDYMIGITPTKVPQEFEDEWTKIYGDGYIPLGMVGMGRPLIQINMTKIL